MLHHTQVKALAQEHAALFKEKGADAVRAALPKVYKGKNGDVEVDTEDVREIISRLESGEITPAKESAKASAEKGPDPKIAKANADIDLSPFDYTRLVGDAWTKYNELEKTLQDRKQYDFAVYRSVPIMKERYPGMNNSPKDIVGIRLVKDAPLRITRIEAKHAKNLNTQLPAVTQDTPCDYYLLAK